jgi:predicted MFS family arabinose efflux permease
VSPRVRIIVLIMVAQTVTNVGPLGVPAIASLIRADLGLTLAQAGSFLSMYYIGPSLISLPAGTLVDRWGVKRLLVLGQVLTAVGLLAASTAHSYTAFILLLVAAGFGYGVLNPTSTKAVMAWSPPAHRATLVGFKQVGLPLGGMLGAALLPALALALGWRTALVASAALIAAGAVASVLVYHDPPDLALPAATPDARGTVMSVLTSRDLWLLSLAAGVFAAMQTVWMSYLVLYLQGIVGLTLLAASRFLALAQLGGMMGRVLFGMLSDRLFGGRRRMPLVMAGVGSTVCTLLILSTGAGASTLGLAALTVVFGVVGIGWNGVQHTWLAELAGPRAAGTAVGLGLAVSSAGVTLGPLLFGHVLQSTGATAGRGRPGDRHGGAPGHLPVRERRRPV